MNRWQRYWMRCAAPRTLPSTSSAFFVLALIFVLGAAVFVAGTLLTRRQKAPPVPVPVTITWTRELIPDDDVPAADLRLDMIERLAIVGAPWCVETLKAALNEESDPLIHDAADRALLVIASR